MLFGYRRVSELRNLFFRLGKDRDRAIYVIVDGPKGTSREESYQVAAVQEMVMEWGKLPNVKVRLSSRNKGLRESIIAGLDWVFSIENQVIVVEDDCYPNDSFLDFCDDMLSIFSQEPAVGMVTGNAILGAAPTSSSYYFSRHPNVWGWATWRDRWLRFRERSNQILNVSEVSRQPWRIVPFGYFRTLTKLMVLDRKTLDSWALDFSLYFYSERLYCIYPQRSLVKNTGFSDSRSTHTQAGKNLQASATRELFWPLEHPTKIRTNLFIELIENATQYLRVIRLTLEHPRLALNKLRLVVKKS